MPIAELRRVQRNKGGILTGTYNVIASDGRVFPASWIVAGTLEAEADRICLCIPRAIIVREVILDKHHGTKQLQRQTKAYEDMRFLESKDARALRILAEYLEPLSRFKRCGVQDTIVFMGSARALSREAAEAALAEAEAAEIGVAAARTALELSTYYEAARELSTRLTIWSKKLDHDERRFVVCR